MEFKPLPKLNKGDKVAILSPSFAAPAKFPEVYESGISRIKEVFGLETIEFPTTRKLGASGEERAQDLMDAFANPEIKAVIASLGGDDQVTYIKNLPSDPFASNPKPFLGFSDNSHFANHLWLNGVPSYYGAAVLTQFAMQGSMDTYTVEYIQHALFDSGEFEIRPSETYNDVGLDWSDLENLNKRRLYESSEGWNWSGDTDAEGISWGGCLESIDEMLRHGISIPTLEQFENIVLFTETSEEVPSAEYVFRVYRALGERGILSRVKGILVGRPKAWEFNKQKSGEEKSAYRQKQRETILDVIRKYNPTVPVVQNMEFGHTDPQVPLPYGGLIRIYSTSRKITATF